MADALTPYTLPEVLREGLLASGLLPGVTFTEEFPKEAVQGTTIVWHIVRRVPGTEHLRERKPRIRPGEPILAEDGSLLTRWGHVFTIIYQFDVIAATNVKANEVAAVFEDYMFAASQALVARGVWHCVFEEQLEDLTLPLPQGLAVRSLRYRVGLDRVLAVSTPLIRTILIAALQDVQRGQVTLTRGTGVLDVLDVENLSCIWRIDREDPDLHPGSEPDFQEGVDWRLLEEEGTRRHVLHWRPEGRQPAAGDSYVVTYYSLAHQSVLRLP